MRITKNENTYKKNIFLKIIPFIFISINTINIDRIMTSLKMSSIMLMINKSCP